MTAIGTDTAVGFVDGEGILVPGREGIRPVVRLIEEANGDPVTLLASLTRHRVPPAAAAAVVERVAPNVAGSDAWRGAVAAGRDRGEAMRRALARVITALAPLDGAVVLCSSTLGPLWWRDIDLLVDPARLAAAETALVQSGFVSLTRLLERLGRGDEVHRFAVIEGADVLASVELSTRLVERGPRAPRPEEVVARAVAPRGRGLPTLAPADRYRRQAAKRAVERLSTVRGALELAAVRDELPTLERDPDATRRLIWVVTRLRNLRRRLDRVTRRRRAVVAFSGIDGSGKSTQAERLQRSLELAGVPSVGVWGRIGFSGSRLLSAVARAGQRALPAGSHSAQRARAQGTGGRTTPLTRRGPVGWMWAFAVTLDYLRIVRAGVRRARGQVVVLDRALPDALVDLEQAFGGELRLGAHRWLVRRLAPRPDVTFYLRISGEAAYERKRDLFTAPILAAYAARFDALAPQLGAVEVDATRPADELAIEIFRAVAGGRGDPIGGM